MRMVDLALLAIIIVGISLIVVGCGTDGFTQEELGAINEILR